MLWNLFLPFPLSHEAMISWWTGPRLLPWAPLVPNPDFCMWLRCVCLAWGCQCLRGEQKILTEDTVHSHRSADTWYRKTTDIYHLKIKMNNLIVTLCRLFGIPSL